MCKPELELSIGRLSPVFARFNRVSRKIESGKSLGAWLIGTFRGDGRDDCSASGRSQIPQDGVQNTAVLEVFEFI